VVVWGGGVDGGGPIEGVAEEEGHAFFVGPYVSGASQRRREWWWCRLLDDVFSYRTKGLVEHWRGDGTFLARGERTVSGEEVD